MFDEIIRIDQSLFEFVNIQLSNNLFDIFFPWITDLHKQFFFNITIYPVILYFLIKKYQKNGIYIFLLCSLVVGTADLSGNYLFKKNIQRLRPAETKDVNVNLRSHASGFSFISNHATNMFACASILSFFLTTWRFYLYLLAVLIAFSRIYNGVHFPLDVLAGALWGVFISYIYWYIWLKINTRFKFQNTMTGLKIDD